MGGTMRLGSRKTYLKTPKCVTAKLYNGATAFDERHRHRYAYLCISVCVYIFIYMNICIYIFCAKTYLKTPKCVTAKPYNGGPRVIYICIYMHM